MKNDFKIIPGYEGIYEINTDGIVRSLNRTVAHKNNRVFKCKSRILTNKLPRRQRYYQVALYRSGKCKMHRTHRLLALTFIPRIPYKDVVNHIDGNPLNNQLQNLEWVTQGENNYHAKKITRNGAVICLKTIKRLYEENKTTTTEEFFKILEKNCS